MSKELRENLSKEIVNQLSLGFKPWEPDWSVSSARAVSIMSPLNPTTGKRYRGGNRLLLGMVAQARGYTDARWMTFNQAKKLEVSVKKGEKGTTIEYWSFTKSVKTDETDPATGKPVYVTKKLDRPFAFYATVFNAQQMTSMPEVIAPELKVHQNDAIDAMVAASGAVLEFGMRDVPCYIPSQDLISMPAKESFHDTEGYYATLLHEMAHWTKAAGRTDRDMKTYAAEELVAELTSVYLCSDFGVPYKLDNHVSYIGDWMEAIDNDKNVFFRAAAEAEKSSDYLMKFANDPDYVPMNEIDLSDFTFDFDSISSLMEEEETSAMSPK